VNRVSARAAAVNISASSAQVSRFCIDVSPCAYAVPSHLVAVGSRISGKTRQPMKLRITPGGG
jgi:hypothetical protein